MATNLGRKYTCYSCHTKFYDLNKAVPLCPKCGADQREAEDVPVATSSRARKVVVEEPVEEPDFEAPETAEPDEEPAEDEEILVEPEAETEEEEEEEY